MAILTLTTDWNQNDYYVGTVKGKILSRCPEVTIVDISHQVAPFNLAQAAFILRNCYRHFPENTVHLVGVETQPERESRYLAIRYDSHFFLTADNGIPDLIMKEEAEKIVEIGKGKEANAPQFPFSEILTDAACILLSGGTMEKLGNTTVEYRKKLPMRAAIDESIITGSVIYIDSFQNAIVNITEELFHRIGKKRAFEIFLQSNHYRISSISQSYADQPVGEIVIIFNSLGLMEIAINHGKAAELLNLQTGSSIRVKFRDT